MSNLAAIYVRDSKNNRASIDRQLEKCKTLAQEKNFEVLQIYMETDNSFIQRKNLIEDCELGKIQTVIVSSLDRLSRNINDIKNLVKICCDYNVTFFCNGEEICPTTTDFVLSIFETMAKFNL